MLRECIDKLTKRISLSEEESEGAVHEMLEKSDPVLSASFIMLLKAKGETAEELVGMIRAMRSHCIQVQIGYPTLDLVGTGGDGKGTVNLSTGSALLAAALGVAVVKHGNRAVSSQCGSADVLEAMGYDIHLSPEQLKISVEKSHFGFCFAPNYHPVLQAVRDVRKTLNVPTAFHLIGPLLNPAGLDHVMLGVYAPELVLLMADVLFRLGTKKSLVFHGGGIDELSCLGPIDAILVTEKGKERITIDPVALGLKRCTIEDLQGADAAYNAALLKKALSGAGTSIDDTLVLNAGVALFLYGHAQTTEEGVTLAKTKLKEGCKRNFLQEIILRKKKPKRARKSLKNALKNTPHAVIAEIKRASPSAGSIAVIDNSAALALEYVSNGAAAISVLTDSAFQGSIQDLESVCEALDKTAVPVLRKDFLLEPSHIAEAAAAGADAVLLIVAVLKDDTARMVQVAHLFGLEALVEVHNEEELKIALEANADLIGVNQRDLNDFSMHPMRFEQLIGSIPKTLVKIAESGIRTESDAAKVFALGYDAVLMGEALSRSKSLLAKVSHAR